MKATKPYITSLPMVTADLQVEVKLLKGCKKFVLQTRPDPASGESLPFRMYVLKEGAWMTVNQYYEEESIDLDAELLVWVASTYPDQILEVLQWV